jgi:transcriptional regulator with XRE-family HTH domain
MVRMVGTSQGRLCPHCDSAAASVSKNTIVDFEKGRRNPTKNNLAAIQRVLEEAGAEFTNGDAPGLRLRKKKR